jgi:hypothetical protein
MNFKNFNPALRRFGKNLRNLVKPSAEKEIVATHHLKIIDNQGQKFSISIELREENRYCFLTAKGSVISQKTFDDIDYWGCLIQLRLALEAEGYLILCRGAKENIVLSGMCRSMGSGLSGYEVMLGKDIEMEDLVSVFEPIESGAVTIETQEKFKEKWFDSL